MNSRHAIAAFAFALIAHSPYATAQTAPAATRPADARIREVMYHADRIVALRGHLGYQMMIEFDPLERIENVAIGDSLGWQVTANRAATLLFLKPVAEDAATNMSVVTTLRRYSFQLSVREAAGPNDPNITYVVRFRYPAPPTAPEDDVPPTPQLAPPPALNFNYSTRGSDVVTPDSVFDDGVMTYFAFAEGRETPAIFVLDQNGDEQLANVQTRDGHVVVDQVAPAFSLRLGRRRAVVRREGEER